jgi:hypothetical protein
MNEVGVSLKGKNVKDIADAVAQALCVYTTTTPNLLSFFLSGTAGPVGNLSSIVVSGIVPQTMSSMMLFRANNKGLKGKNLKNLFDAISNGVSLNLMGMYVGGLTAGIALGMGFGKFSYINTMAVSNYLRSSFVIKMFKGKNVKDIIDAIAYGFSMHMKSTPTVTAGVLGAIAPVPPVGPIPVVMMPTVINTIS